MHQLNLIIPTYMYILSAVKTALSSAAPKYRRAAIGTDLISLSN